MGICNVRKRDRRLCIINHNRIHTGNGVHHTILEAEKGLNAIYDANSPLREQLTQREEDGTAPGKMSAIQIRLDSNAQSQLVCREQVDTRLVCLLRKRDMYVLKQAITI